MLKRQRDPSESQISREEYDMMNANPVATPGGAFSLGSKRRAGGAVNRRAEFYRQQELLNRAFAEYLEQLGDATDLDSADLMDACQEYLDYATSLEERFVRKFGEVLSFGSGDCGQLAHGVDSYESMMIGFPKRIVSLRDKKIVQVACGGLHNVAVSSEGKVYTWGCGDDGSLGRPGEDIFPALVPGVQEHTVVQAAAGDGQSLVLTVGGEVYGWGCYKDAEGKKWFDAGAEGHKVRRMQTEPMRIPALEGVTYICCGDTFNAAITDSGDLYSWGIGEHGELGRSCPKLRSAATGDFDYEAIDREHLPPKRPQLPPGAKARTVGCGAYHMLAVLGFDSGGSAVYGTGLNQYGQLGIGAEAAEEGSRSREALTRISALDGKRVCMVAGGTHHSLCADSTGALYAFGRGDYGQLGIGSNNGTTAITPGWFRPTPVRVPLPPGVVPQSIAVGANHNLVVTSRRELYTWGYGDMNQLGHGVEDASDELRPKKIDFAKKIKGGDALQGFEVMSVDGGGQHSVIIGQVAFASSRS